MSAWTPNDWQTFFTALAAFLAAVAAIVTPIMTLILGHKVKTNDLKATAARSALAAQITQVSAASKDNAEKIEQVHKATNSMKDALVSATAASNLAAGKELGRIEGKAEEIANPSTGVQKSTSGTE
jgi:hypothetical protein